MAISEDTAALVAAQLVRAHIANSARSTNGDDDNVKGWVLELYSSYFEAVKPKQRPPVFG